MKKFIVLIAVFFLFGCETPLNHIIVYSGNWRIICSNPANILLPEFTIAVKDDGTFNNKTSIYPNVDTVFLMGKIDNNGTMSAQFGDSLGVNKYGEFYGSFYEVSGLLYGDGKWKDSAHGSYSYGTWVAKNN